MNPNLTITINVPYSQAKDMVKAKALSPIMEQTVLDELKTATIAVEDTHACFLHLLTLPQPSSAAIDGIRRYLGSDSWLYDVPEFKDWLVTWRRVVL